MYKNRNRLISALSLFSVLFISLFLFSGVWAQYKDWQNIPNKPKEKKGYCCVFATREGLVGTRTYTGLLITDDNIFVALPHYEALYKWVEVKYKDKIITCQVLDIGTWSTLDRYWKYNRRPLAETRERLPKEWETKYGKPTNPSGMDLSDGLVKALGIKKAEIGVWIHWRFVNEKP